MEDLLIKLSTLLAALAGSWAVVRQKTESHARAIARLEAAKEALYREYSHLDKELAVVQAQALGNDRRLTESLAQLEKAIETMETRVTAHIDSLAKSLRG